MTHLILPDWKWASSGGPFNYDVLCGDLRLYTERSNRRTRSEASAVDVDGNVIEPPGQADLDWLK
jgi:hypothetical protein